MLWKRKDVSIKKKLFKIIPLCDHPLAKSPVLVVDGITNCFEWYLLHGFNNTRLQSGKIGVSTRTCNLGWFLKCTRANHRRTKQFALGARLINFPQTWGEQRTPGTCNGHPAHPILFVFAQKTDKFRFVAAGIRTICGWRSAGLQSCPYAFGLRTIREQFANHLACSCIWGYKAGSTQRVVRVCDTWMCLKRFVESDTYTWYGNVPVGRKILRFGECAVYYTYFCGWKFERSRIELKFRFLGAQHYWGRWNRFWSPWTNNLYTARWGRKFYEKCKKETLWKLGKMFIDFEKNTGKTSLTYLRIRERILRNRDV